MKNVGLLIFNEVEVMDFAEPFEVFSLSEDEEKLYKVFTVSEKDEMISARNGFLLKPCVPSIPAFISAYYYSILGKPVFSCDSALYIREQCEEGHPGVRIRRVNGCEMDDEVTAYYRNAISLLYDNDTGFTAFFLNVLKGLQL